MVRTATIGLLAISLAVSPTVLAAQIANEEGTLVVPNHWDGEINCANYGECPALEGVSYVDVEVGDAYQDPEVDGWYNLHAPDQVRYLVEQWQICFYEGDGDRLNCRTHGGDWLFHGPVPTDTEIVRVILRYGPAAEYQLRLFN